MRKTSKKIYENFTGIINKKEIVEKLKGCNNISVENFYMSSTIKQSEDKKLIYEEIYMKGNIEAKAMKKLNSNSSEFEILLDRMDKLGNSLNTKIDEMGNNLNNKIDNLRQDMQNQIDTLNNKVDSGFKEVNTRLDNVENRLDKVEQRLENVEKDVSLIKSCPTIQKEIKQLKKNKNSN